MTNQVVPRFKTGKGLTKFNPKKVRANQAKADALVSAAAAIGNWEAVDAVVRDKVDEIAETVKWWDDSVQGAGGFRRK